MRSKINIKFIVYVIWLFLFIYMPPLFSISTALLGSCFAFVYLYLNHRTLKTFSDSKKIVWTFVYLIILCIYLFCIGLLQTDSISKVYSSVGGLIYLLIFSFPGALALGCLARRNKYTIEHIIKALAAVGTIQGILSILAFIFDGIQSFFAFFLSNIMLQSDIDYWRDFRLFGLSSSMSYAMPIVQGVIGILVLIYALRRNSKYMYLVPVIWAAGILNARTSIVVILLGLLLILIFGTGGKRLTISKKLLTTELKLALVAVIFIGIFSLSSNNLTTEWIFDGVQDIFSIFKGEKSGYFQYFEYYKASLYIPTGIDLIFGAGEMKYQSDIGYVHDLWIGGIFYCLLVYALFAKLIRNSYKHMNLYGIKVAKVICLFMFTTLMVVNIKGYIFGVNEFTNLLFLFFIVTEYMNFEWKKVL